MRTSSTPRSRQLSLLCGLLILALTACGVDGTEAEGREERGTRMREVADAWQGAKALETWHRGFYPLHPLTTELPEGAFRSGTDKDAHLSGRYVATVPLPTRLPRTEVRWPDGTTGHVSTLTARQTLDLLGEKAEQVPPAEGTLRVTGVRLAASKVATSRGTARVPAWEFTVAGYDRPFRRPAVTASVIPKSPIAPVERETYAQMPVETLKSVSDDGRSVTVLVPHGACDGGGTADVLETGAAVVLAGFVLPRKDGGSLDGPCTANRLLATVTVRLKRPLGERVLLDSLRGVPVQQSLY
ncbi:hypothetical protein ACIO3O_40960 [Streptomyces sp. NPDC087440]|uniref:hypothetical protein n=1 Tax=Streptomyces sp. NPDC087440 TaxID=3365790 RepID=UPI0037F632E4